MSVTVFEGALWYIRLGVLGIECQGSLVKFNWCNFPFCKNKQKIEIRNPGGEGDKFCMKVKWMSTTAPLGVLENSTGEIGSWPIDRVDKNTCRGPH